jgi:predicted DNA-binding transcriptional regulator YafY
MSGRIPHDGAKGCGVKSERLLAMLLMLQARGRACAREIASSLEVSERTVYRDLDSLSAAGIPVHAERGARGGIVLADGYRRALTQFRDEEIRALFASAADTLADVGLGVDLRRALDKLKGALNESQRRAAANVRGRIHIDPRRWKQAAQPRAMLSALRTACAEDRRTVLNYKDRNGKVTERVIEPLGLVAKAGVWYIVARYGPEMRVFRADRMLGLDVTTERFERPADFDLDRYWNEWSAEFERNLPGYPVILRVADDAIEDVTSYWESDAVDEGKRGWTPFRLLFPSLEVAVAHVLAWGERVEALEPAELRSTILARALGAMRRYKAQRREGNRFSAKRSGGA